MDTATAKAELRARVRSARAARPEPERAAAAADLTDILIEDNAIAAATVVTCYLAIGGEPNLDPLVQRLAHRGVRVLLPILRGDGDLDWAAYDGDVVTSARGLREPAGAALGVDAIAQAAVVIAPALAVDATGNRLGQGGGGYDRALLRVPSAVTIVAVVYDDELVDTLPAEGHDVPVTAAATPTRMVRFPA